MYAIVFEAVENGFCRVILFIYFRFIGSLLHDCTLCLCIKYIHKYDIRTDDHRSNSNRMIDFPSVWSVSMMVSATTKDVTNFRGLPPEKKNTQHNHDENVITRYAAFDTTVFSHQCVSDT